MQAIWAAALAGLLATPHCAAMCGGFAAACARGPARNARRPVRIAPGPGRGDRLDNHTAPLEGPGHNGPARPGAGLWAWHLGRLATYATLGALAGLFGGALPGPAWVPAVLSGALLLWFAAALAGLAPQPSFRVPGLSSAGRLLASRGSPLARIVFGAVTGLLPCGMVYAALSIAIAAGSPLHGAAAMAAFGAATVPGLTVVAVGVQRLALRSRWSRRAMAAVVLVLGLWSVAQRGFGDAPHAHGSAATPSAATSHAH